MLDNAWVNRNFDERKRHAHERELFDSLATTIEALHRLDRH